MFFVKFDFFNKIFGIFCFGQAFSKYIRMISLEASNLMFLKISFQIESLAKTAFNFE